MMRIYADTPVFGGCFDYEFEKWPNKLMEEFKHGLKSVVISDLASKELEGAPPHVRNLIEEIPKEHKEHVVLDDDAAGLGHYIENGTISRRHLVDVQHIAMAAVNKIDILVSWNFKHIVNLSRIRLYNSVNLK
ncbi:MAG: PIN domain protein [Euryarchaeota archaeon]|nr:PIN domain protein [Euryarchaeota archaeon]